MDTTVHVFPIGAPGAGTTTLTGAIAAFGLRMTARMRERLAAARHRREAEAHLAGMTDRDLRDIGLTRHELHRLFNHGWS
jgi:uncharacterized protein YjiS (DUF1127 family)